MVQSMSLTIQNRAGQRYSNKVGERDVTIKLTDGDGVTKYVSGFYTEIGMPALGCELDPDPEFEMEYGQPLYRLTFIGYNGPMKAFEAWTDVNEGSRKTFSSCYVLPVPIQDGDAITVVGPPF